MSKLKLLAPLALLLALVSNNVGADEVRVAVAANFTKAIKQIAPLYEKKTGNKLVASFGSTGQLYTQIKNGAPFDAFLAADEKRPKKLIAEDAAVADSYFVYARGRLALWSSTPGYVDDKGAVLKTGDFKKIAIANPKAAPYGEAAIETLTALKLLDTLQSKLVIGENISQTQQFVASGSVPLGFVALAQVKSLPADGRGSWWVVPETMHTPIAQGAVLLKKTDHAATAKNFLAFLKSPEAVTIIRELGYDVPSD